MSLACEISVSSVRSTDRGVLNVVPGIDGCLLVCGAEFRNTAIAKTIPTKIARIVIKNRFIKVLAADLERVKQHLWP